MSKLSAGASLVAGAIAAYLFDPDSGRARRARAQDQALAAVRSLKASTSAQATYQRNVIAGWIHESTNALRRPRRFDDSTLIQKVKSEVLGRWTAQGNPQVHVEAVDGSVKLTTSLSDPEAREDLVTRVRQVEGVRDVCVRDGLSGSDGPTA